MDLEYIRHTTEFQVFDRKSVRIEPKALAVPIIAMANADGGVIALGVEDDGALTGATIWQHEVVRRNESDQVEGKSDQVGTNFDQAEGKSDQVPEVMVREFLAKFDAVVAPKYKYASAREQARNNCWKVLTCIRENENVSRDGLCNMTGIKPSTLKTIIGYMREAEIIDYEGVTSSGRWVVTLTPLTPNL